MLAAGLTVGSGIYFFGLRGAPPTRGAKFNQSSRRWRRDQTACVACDLQIGV